MATVPPGFLVDSAWFEANGIGRRSAYDYVQAGWLERLDHGVFRRPVAGARPSALIDWQTCVLSLQHVMGYPVHIGGMTALALQGYSHYLPLGGGTPVWLYGTSLPKWLSKVSLDAPLVTRSRSLFADSSIGLTEEQDKDNPGTRADALPWHWAIRMSTPERAVLEALAELPRHESFDHLDKVFEGLTTLRPKLLNALLKACRTIKVRRLFFVFADRHAHAWRVRLDPDDFDLGRGDRAFIRGGKLHPRYRIVVPEPYAEPTREGADDA